MNTNESPENRHYTRLQTVAPGKDWNEAVSRRRFLKKTGLASISTALAFNPSEASVPSTLTHSGMMVDYAVLYKYVYVQTFYDFTSTNASAKLTSLHSYFTGGSFDAVAPATPHPTFESKTLYRFMGDPQPLVPQDNQIISENMNGPNHVQVLPTMGWAWVISYQVRGKYIYRYDAALS